MLPGLPALEPAPPHRHCPLPRKRPHPDETWPNRAVARRQYAREHLRTCRQTEHLLRRHRRHNCPPPHNNLHFSPESLRQLNLNSLRSLGCSNQRPDGRHDRSATELLRDLSGVKHCVDVWNPYALAAPHLLQATRLNTFAKPNGLARTGSKLLDWVRQGYDLFEFWV